MPTPNFAGRVTLLGNPCQARNINSGLVVRDAGRDWLVVGNMNENSRMELIFIDPTTDSGEVYRAPAGSGSWALQKLPGNRLAVGTFYDGMFLVFDIGRREWVTTVKFPGEDYIWTFAAGKDGRIYGGTYPGGKLGAWDAETYAFEDLGAPSAGNKYLRWTSSLPDGRIFCQAGFNTPETLVFDPTTGQFTPAPAELQSATQGVAWNGYFLAGNAAYRMPDLSPVTPLPFPTPDPSEGAWSVDLRLTSSDILVLRQGYELFRFRAGGHPATLTPWALLPEKGLGAIFGAGENGRLLGIRGQEYFSLAPGDKVISPHRIPGEAAPRDTMFLRADSRGRLWGGPTFGQTLFYHDVESGKTVNTNAISDHGGEAYDVAVIGGVCYAVSYSGGEIIRFDPEAKWDQAGNVNPRTIARVGPEYIRPSAGVEAGSDGRLYSGWLAKYGAYGGALVITEPSTGETEVIDDPLGPHGIAGLAVAGNLVLLSTSTYGNGLGHDKEASAQFGAYDLAAGKIVFVQQFPGIAAVHCIVYYASGGIAAFLVDDSLWLFDVISGKPVGDAPVLAEKVTSDLRVRGESLLYGVGTALLSRDFATGLTTMIAEAPGKIDKIAVAPDQTVYIASGSAVYKIDM